MNAAWGKTETGLDFQKKNIKHTWKWHGYP